MDNIHRILRDAKAGRASKRDYQSPNAIDYLIERLEIAAKADEDREKYNGWTNRETWALALHIDNNEWMHNRRGEILDSIKNAAKKRKSPDDCPWTNEEYVRFHFADKLKDWSEGMAESFFNGSRGPWAKDIKMMVEDVGSFWRVNWQEIADNFIQASE